MIRGFLSRLIILVRQRGRDAVLAASFAELNDHTLADIGLMRDWIPAAARGPLSRTGKTHADHCWRCAGSPKLEIERTST